MTVAVTLGVALLWAFVVRNGRPKLAFGLSHYRQETVHGRTSVFAVVNVTNTGTGAAAIELGVGPDYSESPPPFYLVMAASPNGWISASPVFCGVATRRRLLGPGNHLAIDVDVTRVTNRMWKVGLGCSKVSLSDRVPRSVSHWVERFVKPYPTFTSWGQPMELPGPETVDF